MKTIFAVVYNNKLNQAVFFNSKQKALKHLQEIKAEHTALDFVEIVNETPDSFTFKVGPVFSSGPTTFRIIEIPVK